MDLPFPDHVPLRSGIASCARADVAAAPTSANAKTRYLIASSRADAISWNCVAGGLGFEPRLTESESAVLPLNYPPIGTRQSVSVASGARPRLVSFLLVSAGSNVDATPAHLGHLGWFSKHERPGP